MKICRYKLSSIQFPLNLLDFNEQNYRGHSKANGSQDVLISGVVPRARQADYPSDKEEREH